MKTPILLLLGAGIALQNFSQSATLDLEMNVPFITEKQILTKNKFRKPHKLILSTNDKNKFFEHFNKHIKDTSDYDGILLGAKEGYLVSYDAKRFIDESKNNTSPFFDVKFPYLYKDGVITDVLLLEKSDPETGEVFVDENGDIIYVGEDIRKQAVDEVISIYSYEDWKIDKKGFHKYVRAMSNLMYTYDEEWNYKPVYKQAFNKALKIKLKTNKKSIFKKDVGYDYLFFPNYDSLQKNHKCLTNGYSVDEYYFKAKDEILNGISKNEADVFVNNLFIALKNGDAQMLDEKGNPFENPLNELYREQTIEVFDENTGEAKLDEKGDVMYIVEKIFLNYRDVVGFHFLEDWYFAKNTYGIVKKVKAIQLLIANYDDNGNKAGYLKSPYKIVF